MKIKEKIKRYFTEEPKQNFWFWACITIIVFRYVAPTILLMSIPFSIGLVAPDTPINYVNISQNVANNLISPMEKFNEIGSEIGRNNPITAHILFFFFGHIVYVIYLMVIILALNLFRYGISWIYRKSTEKTTRNKLKSKYITS